MKRMQALCFLLLMSTLGMINCQTAKEPSEPPKVPELVESDEVAVANYDSSYIWLRFKRYPKAAFVSEIWWDGSYQGWHLVKDRIPMPQSEKSEVRVGYRLYDKNRQALSEKKEVILRLRSATKEAQESKKENSRYGY